MYKRRIAGLNKNITIIVTTTAAIMIFNQLGAPVYKASNINNSISLSKLSAGTYHYLPRAKDENNIMQEYSGVIVIMD